MSNSRTVAFDVGFVREFSKTVAASFDGSPSICSTIILSVIDQSAEDAKIVLSNGFITSIVFPKRTLNKIFSEESVPFEL